MGDSQCWTLSKLTHSSYSPGSGSKFSTPNLDCQKWPKWIWVKFGYPNNQMINPYDIGYSNTKNELRFVVPQVLNFNPEIILVPVAPHLYGEPTVHQHPPRAGTASWRMQHQHRRPQDTGPENTSGRKCPSIHHHKGPRGWQNFMGHLGAWLWKKANTAEKKGGEHPGRVTKLAHNWHCICHWWVTKRGSDAKDSLRLAWVPVGRSHQRVRNSEWSTWAMQDHTR